MDFTSSRQSVLPYQDLTDVSIEYGVMDSWARCYVECVCLDLMEQDEKARRSLIETNKLLSMYDEAIFTFKKVGVQNWMIQILESNRNHWLFEHSLKKEVMNEVVEWMNK